MPPRIEICTRWPRPVWVRWYSAAQIAPNRCTALPESPIWAPVTTGGPSSKPVVLIAPPVAWAMFSYALAFSSAPGPKPFSDAKMMPRVDLVDALPR